MKPRTLRYQTFAEIADKMAKKEHGDWWRARRDDYLEALIQDHWLGRFMDSAGQSCVFYLDPRQTGTPATITREAVWRLLGCYKPQTVREVPEDSPPPCKTLGAVKITDYGGTVVHDVFEFLGLSEADARAWMDQYDDENSPRVKSGPQHTPSAVPPEPAVIAGGASRASEGGRPTFKSEIEVAYQELLAAGDINFDAPKNTLYEPIRKKVQQYKGDPSLKKGLQEEAIRKVISPLFEADKNKRSASP